MCNLKVLLVIMLYISITSSVFADTKNDVSIGAYGIVQAALGPYAKIAIDYILSHINAIL